MYGIKRVNTDDLLPLIKEIMTNGGSTRITVTGSSMYPFLRENTDSFVLSSVEYEMLRKGDIVIVKDKTEEYILHRIISINKSFFYTCGDAQKKPEGPFTRDQVIGAVTSLWRGNIKIDCNSRGWRLLVWIWLLFRPFRNYLIRAYGIIRYIKSKLA